MTTTPPPSVVAGITFIGRGGGAVKSLGGFRKQHHTVPDAANAITNAFLGKICASELGEEAENLFQAVRTALGYRRKDLALTLTSPLAVLTAKDFTLEITYALEESDPARYAVTTTLHSLKSAELAHTPEFTGVFATKFSEISFALKKGARVEAVIDAIEALDAERGLTVSYPSDYRECEIRVTGVDARVRCTGASLEMIFPKATDPAALIVQFGAVRDLFQMNKGLRGILE